MIEGQEGVTWEQWHALGREVEDSGLEGLFRSDHYAGLMGDETRGSLDAWTQIAALAALTSRIRLGTLVSPITFRHPAVLAKAVVTADHVSGGRVELGIGAGWNVARARGVRLPVPGAARAPGAARGAARAHRPPVDGGATSSHDGRHYRLDGPRRAAEAAAAAAPARDRRRRRQAAHGAARRPLRGRVQHALRDARAVSRSGGRRVDAGLRRGRPRAARLLADDGLRRRRRPRRATRPRPTADGADARRGRPGRVRPRARRRDDPRNGRRGRRAAAERSRRPVSSGSSSSTSSTTTSRWCACSAPRSRRRSRDARRRPARDPVERVLVLVDPLLRRVSPRRVDRFLAALEPLVVVAALGVVEVRQLLLDPLLLVHSGSSRDEGAQVGALDQVDRQR